MKSVQLFKLKKHSEILLFETYLNTISHQYMILFVILILLQDPASGSKLFDSSFSVPTRSNNLYTNPPPNLDILQVVVISRHGDRSQIGKSLDALKDLEAAEKMWASRMPSVEKLSLLAKAATFPTNCLDKKDVYYGRDKMNYPFGMLTEEGTEQLIRLGKVKELYCSV